MTEAEWLTSKDTTAMYRWLTMSMAERMAEAASQLALARIDAQMLGLPEPAAIPPVIPKVTDRKIRLFCHAVLQVCGRGPFDDDYYPTPSVETWGRSCAAEVREPSLLSRYPNLDRAHLLREVAGNPLRKPPVFRRVVCSAADMSAGAIEAGATEEVVWQAPWLTPDVLSLAEAAYKNRVEQLGDHQQYERFVTNIGTTNSRCLVCGYVATSNKIERNHRQFCSGSGTLDPELFIILSDALEEAGCLPGEDCRECVQFSRQHVWEFLACHGSPTIRVGGEILSHLRSPGLHVRGCWVLDLLLGKE